MFVLKPSTSNSGGLFSFLKTTAPFFGKQIAFYATLRVAYVAYFKYSQNKNNSIN